MAPVAGICSLDTQRQRGASMAFGIREVSFFLQINVKLCQGVGLIRETPYRNLPLCLSFFVAVKALKLWFIF